MRIFSLTYRLFFPLLIFVVMLLFAQQVDAVVADRFFYPLESWSVTVHDGERLGGGRYHAGVDAGLELSAGAPVYAIAAGEVKEAQERSLFGEVILIEHELEDGREVVSLYGHLWPGRSLVEPGDHVEAGQQIGILGNRRNNGGWVVHLHFGIHREPYTGEWVYWGHVTDRRILRQWFDAEDFLAERSARFPTPRIVIPRHVLALQHEPTGKQRLGLYTIRGRKSPLHLTKQEQNRLNDIAVTDIDQNGKMNILGIGTNEERTKSIVTIYNRKGRFMNQFEAFHTSMRAGGRITTGDVDGDGVEEIIVGSGAPFADRVKIFESDGRLIATIHPFARTSSHKGIDVAAGDVDGDGTEEIIVGKRGGTSTVAILRLTGERMDVFRVYDAKYRKGINISAGDVDDDGKAEVIVAPNGGKQNTVFVYDQRLYTPDQFNRRSYIAYTPFRQVIGAPIDVSVVDWENDGKQEIQMSIIESEGVGRIKTYRYSEEKRVLYNKLLKGKNFTTGARIAGWVMLNEE